MPHRDMDRRTASNVSAQDLSRVLDALWPRSESDRVSFAVRPDCRWTARGLVLAALLWTWSTRGTLGERLAQALGVLRALAAGFAPERVSYQAFVKLLERRTETLAASLKAAFRERMRECGDALVTGYAVFAIDGTKLRLPRTRSNETRFAPAKTRGKKGRGKRPRSRAARARRAGRKKADCPQASLTVAFHAGLRLPWAWRFGASDVGEREQARALLDELPDEALIAADCGFHGYEFWSDLIDSGRSFVIRVGGNVRLLRKLGRVRRGRDLVHVWPRKIAARGLPPLALRLLTVHDGRRAWHLVTNVLDPKGLSDADVAAIYRRRWGVEVYFRHFKRTFGRAKLRSRKAEHSACEAEWSLLGLWAMLLYARRERDLADVEGRVSPARVLRAFGRAIDEPTRLASPGETLVDALRAATADGYARRDKRSRGYPRKKYESRAKPPIVRLATAAERRLARLIALRTAA